MSLKTGGYYNLAYMQVNKLQDKNVFLKSDTQGRKDNEYY